jgi:hypothetical protein
LRPIDLPAEVKAPLVAIMALTGSFWLSWRLFVRRSEPAWEERHA